MVTALQAAIAARHPGAMLVDRDSTAAYLVMPGERGLRRTSFRTLASGKIRLGRLERLQLAQAAAVTAEQLQDALEEALPGHAIEVEAFGEGRVVFRVDGELNGATFAVDDEGGPVVSAPLWPISEPQAATRQARLDLLDERVKLIALQLGKRPPGSAPPASENRDYAELPPSAYGETPAPRPYRPARAPAAGTEVRLHNLSHIGEDADFAALPPDAFLKPAPDGGDVDFAPCPAPPWDRQS
jgi:hypothetical protein